MPALLIGLTGGTGSGKSTVARVWAGLGAVVIDADALAREVVAAGTEGLAVVQRHFGPDIVGADGQLRRAELAAIVFADPAQLRALEAITHPLIEQRTAELIEAAPAGGVVVHDMPLIVERGIADRYDLVVVVDAPVDVRVQRLVGRGMAADDARRRIAAQASTEQRRAVADVWIDNTADQAQLEKAATVVWHDRVQPLLRSPEQRRRGT